MLAELNVKDIALIKKASVTFGEGLNILTGETGAGKSVVIGSAMLALGAKARGDMIRKGAEYGYAELIFFIDDQKEKERLAAMGYAPDEDGQLVISRKIMPQRSQSQINGETVTLSRLREVCAGLIDIYGQDEHRSLMSEDEHLRILDGFIADEIQDLRRETAEAYDAYREALRKEQSFDMDESERLREQELCRYEIDEIMAADIKDGEEEELSQRYRKLSNLRSVVEDLSRAAEYLRGPGCAEAMDEIREAARYDTELTHLYEELSDADGIVASVLREIDGYIDDADIDGRLLAETEERLELVRRLEQKYGGSCEKIRAYLKKRQERLELLSDYENNKKAAVKEREACRARLEEACEKLGRKRREGAERFCREVTSELLELNFSDVVFEMDIRKKEPGRDGADIAVFTAALNPGEDPKPLMEAASGGELSRVMLAIKTVLAETDDIATLIFDEIDTGISGRTAQKVSERLCLISSAHQVICITHLPQIAAMADRHYLISKSEQEGRNVTDIELLDEEESVGELARMLSGAEVTQSVYENAREMKKLAGELKKQKRSGSRRLQK